MRKNLVFAIFLAVVIGAMVFRTGFRGPAVAPVATNPAQVPTIE